MSARAARALALAALAACAGAGREAPALVLLDPDAAPPRGRVEVRGAGTRAPAGRLVVRVAEGGEGALPVAGEEHVEGGALVFVPRFPFARGVGYRATFTPAEGGAPVERTASFPAPAREPSTVVRAVHPDADELPANLLRFYVQFSAPMARGEAARRVRLVEVGRGEAEGVLLELEEELWDPDGTRLTLLLDPGRIKQGLRKRDELGPTLHPGRTYELVVDPDWRDARGASLARGFVQRFRTTEDDRESPDPRAWTIAAPAHGTRVALSVTFDEPLDRALLERVLSVRGPDGKLLAGRPAVVEGERGWTFVPDEPWRPGSHALEVETILEDRSGNDLERPFEVDLRAPRAPVTSRATIRLVFLPKDG